MRALVFCAGLGTRLRPVVKDCPKCMVKIGDKPILEHILKHLEKHGIEEVMINLHHRPLKFMRYFGTRLTYLYEKELLGEEKTIEVARPWLGDRFVVMNGDTLTNVNITKMIELHNRAKAGKTTFIDNEVNAGTWIYGQGILEAKYQEPGAFWVDMGTPGGLEKARKKYEEVNNLSSL